MWRLSLGAGLHFTALDALKGAVEARRPNGKLTASDAFVVKRLAVKSSSLSSICMLIA